MSNERLKLLFEAVGDAENILIMPHNNPDPDAIASAVALRHLLAEKLNVESHIAYHGFIGRAENKVLIRYLGHPLQRLADMDRPWLMPLALVNTQPGIGNITLPPQAKVVIFIDHNPGRDATPTTSSSFVDVRPDLGATSTILVEYLQAAGLALTPLLATALFYGIKTNTLGLGRNASPADVTAYFDLQFQIDTDALAEIERAQVPANYFKNFNTILQATQIYDTAVISYFGSIDYPDLTAEMADILLRLEEAQWVICLGVYQDTLFLSVRARERAGAGQLAQAIVKEEGTWGGHGPIAGGQIPLKVRDPEQLISQIKPRILRHLNLRADVVGRPLI